MSSQVSVLVQSCGLSIGAGRWCDTAARMLCFVLGAWFLGGTGYGCEDERGVLACSASCLFRKSSGSSSDPPLSPFPSWRDCKMKNEK